jgi:hypothetical protein
MDDSNFNRVAVLAPEILKSVWRQLGIAHGVLDVSVTEIGLESPRIVPLVGQGEAAGVAKHIGMGLGTQGAPSHRRAPQAGRSLPW